MGKVAIVAIDRRHRPTIGDMQVLTIFQNIFGLTAATGMRAEWQEGRLRPFGYLFGASVRRPVRVLLRKSDHRMFRADVARCASERSCVTAAIP